MKHIINIVYVAIVYALFMVGTTDVQAAQVTFMVVPNLVEHDTTTIVEAYIDPKEPINAIEGMIGLLGEGIEHVSSVVVETGGSAFSLWPVLPMYSEEDHVIRFTGGTTNTILSKALLFRMRIFSKKPGEVSVSWLNGSAYLNDGKGTVEGISSRSLAISLTRSEPNQISASSPDSQPPKFEALEVSQDPDIYDGKYFLSFYANDDISGIARYEVVEGQVTTEVSNGIYVLRDQERKTKIVVIAYDQAGNSTSIKVPARYDWLLELMFVVSLLLVTLLVFFRYRVRFR